MGMEEDQVAGMHVYTSNIPNKDARESQSSPTSSGAVSMSTLIGSDIYGWEEGFDQKVEVVIEREVGTIQQSAGNGGPRLCPRARWRRKGLLYKVFETARRRIEGSTAENR